MKVFNVEDGEKDTRKQKEKKKNNLQKDIWKTKGHSLYT